MDNPPRVTYYPRPGATPEGEVTALAAVYRLILEDVTDEKAAGEDGGDDARKEIENARDAGESIRE